MKEETEKIYTSACDYANQCLELFYGGKGIDNADHLEYASRYTVHYLFPDASYEIQNSVARLAALHFVIRNTFNRPPDEEFNGDKVLTTAETFIEKQFVKLSQEVRGLLVSMKPFQAEIIREKWLTNPLEGTE